MLRIPIVKVQAAVVKLTALGTILRRFDQVAVTDTVQYRTGSGFCWPVSVHVALRRG